MTISRRLMMGGMLGAGLAPALARDSDAAIRMLLVARAPGDPLYDFYAARDFTPVWSGSGGARNAAMQAAAALKQAEAHGLRKDDYAVTANRWPDGVPDDEVAQYDVSLTLDVLQYATDLRCGRTMPRDVYKDVALPRQDFAAGAELNRALKTHGLGAFLLSLPPPHAAYRAMAKTLENYRLISAQGGWPVIDGAGEVKPDPAAPRYRTLALRLALEDPVLSGMAEPSLDDISAALTRFQDRNGMTPDGRAGPATLAALNVTVETRIDQLIANMERWRWAPRTFENRYIYLNVPDQAVQYVADGRVWLSTRAIVGKQSTTTPILRTMALDLVVNPPWHVPGDIAEAQILPKLRRDPRYLADRHMALINGPADDPQGLKVDWKKLKTMPYDIDQAPGPDGAMGALMLDSPNDFDVYLHDTPGKALFKAPQRQKSNGCIRVEDMLSLASLALTGDTDTSAPALKQIIEGRATQRITLDQPLPVYLLYWTAVPADDGMVGFRSDFYGRDKALLAAMAATRA